MLLNPPTAPENMDHSKRLMYLHKCPYASAGRASYQMSCFMRSLFHQTTPRTSSIVRYGIKLPPSCSDTRDTTHLQLRTVIVNFHKLSLYNPGCLSTDSGQTLAPPALIVPIADTPCVHRVGAYRQLGGIHGVHYTAPAHAVLLLLLLLLLLNVMWLHFAGRNGDSVRYLSLPDQR